LLVNGKIARIRCYTMLTTVFLSAKHTSGSMDTMDPRGDEIQTLVGVRGWDDVEYLGV